MSSQKEQKRTFVLGFAIVANLAFLGFYKYLTPSLNVFFNIGDYPLSKTIPLGISFYTFTQIAFLVDCYKKSYEKKDFLNYALFVSYFPHLACGPILSFKDLYPQLTNSKKFNVCYRNIALFAFCFSIGLFKKLFIADAFSGYVIEVFDAPITTVFDQKTAILGTVSYALQLYFDFSGYSDIAVGLSYLFGLKIPDNFNAPYQATSIIEFWRRWHISLSLFLRNYLYIPMGGNRSRHYLNIIVTMLLGGLWHGGAWTFVVWGGYHGLLLSLNHWIRQLCIKRERPVYWTRVLAPLKIVVTFVLVCLGWILFRSQTLESALQLYSSLFGNALDGVRVPRTFSYSFMVVSLLVVFFVPDTLTLRAKLLQWIDNQKKIFVAVTAALCAFSSVLGLISLGGVQLFLYAGF